MFCALLTVITDETRTFHPTGELSSNEAEDILYFIH